MEVVPNVHQASGSGSSPSYFLVDIKNILKVVHIVTYFGQQIYEKDAFFINK